MSKMDRQEINSMLNIFFLFYCMFASFILYVLTVFRSPPYPYPPLTVPHPVYMPYLHMCL